MIDVYQYKPRFGVLNASYFCMKLEVYLRLAGIPYQVHNIDDPRRAPKHKLPFIKDREQIIVDTTFIIDHLKQQYGDALDKELTLTQQAESRALQCLIEDHLYWILVYLRWFEPQGWNIMKEKIFSNMPLITRYIAPLIIRQQIKNSLWAQGIGRHSMDEIYLLGKKDVSALADLLNTDGFFWGNKPTSIDACIYAMLANILYTPPDSPLKIAANKCPEIVAYCNRMDAFLNITREQTI